MALTKLKKISHRLDRIARKTLLKPFSRAKRSETLQGILETEGEFFVNSYGTYFVPASFKGRLVPRILMKAEVYEPDTLEFIRRRCGTGHVVTAGAFIGDFIPAISTGLAPGAKVWTFEPNPVCFHACRETIRLNGLSNVVLDDKALGSAKGEVVMRVYDFETDEPAAAQSSIDPTRSEVAPGYIPVEVVKLDDVLPAEIEISILHLDLEGFEMEALKGAAGIIRRCRPIVILENAKDYMAQVHSVIGDRYRFGGTMERNGFFFYDGG